MTYTIHGDPALIVFLLAILGAATILTSIQNWVSERISLDLHPLWHVIPRRFKVSVRWDRPHALVGMDDGREAVIVLIHAGESDQDPLIALVQPQEECVPAEWALLSSLSPLPGHSFRETWRAMRGKENESA